MRHLSFRSRRLDSDGKLRPLTGRRGNVSAPPPLHECTAGGIREESPSLECDQESSFAKFLRQLLFVLQEVSTLKTVKNLKPETVHFNKASQTLFFYTVPLSLQLFFFLLFLVASSYCENHVGSQDFCYSPQQITACGMAFFVIIRQKRNKKKNSESKEEKE